MPGSLPFCPTGTNRVPTRPKTFESRPSPTFQFTWTQTPGQDASVKTDVKNKPRLRYKGLSVGPQTFMDSGKPSETDPTLPTPSDEGPTPPVIKFSVRLPDLPLTLVPGPKRGWGGK